MAYKLLAPPSMAHTDRARTAGKGWRTPLGFRGSSTSLRASSSPDSQSPTLPSHTTILHTPCTSHLIIQQPKRPFLQLKDPGDPTIPARHKLGAGPVSRTCVHLLWAMQEPSSVSYRPAQELRQRFPLVMRDLLARLLELPKKVPKSVCEGRRPSPVSCQGYGNPCHFLPFPAFWGSCPTVVGGTYALVTNAFEWLDDEDVHSLLQSKGRICGQFRTPPALPDWPGEFRLSPERSGTGCPVGFSGYKALRCASGSTLLACPSSWRPPCRITYIVHIFYQIGTGGWLAVQARAIAS